MSEIKLIDSHCHLIFENFQEDLEDVVLRWRSKGVKKLLHACCELSEIPKLKKISQEFEEVYYSVGLHPLEADQWEQSSKNILRHAELTDKRVVAIGELGLDFFKSENRAVFECFTVEYIKDQLKKSFVPGEVINSINFRKPFLKIL